ncbi:MAG: hypothetical protein U0271_47060 [Polyangiaceae bacterium]
MPMTLVRSTSGDGFSLLAWRSLVVLVWQSAPTYSSVNAATPGLLSLVQRCPHKALFCAITPPDLSLPDAPAREALQKGVKQLDPYLLGAVNIVLASGFASAAVRGVLTGFQLLARPGYPVSFVGTHLEAASFLVRNWPRADAPAPDALELEAALASL